MRVLQVFKTYWPDTFGGVERTIDAIARSTGDLGVETTVLAPSRTKRGPSEFRGYRVVHVRQDFEIASTGFSLEAVSALRREAAKADIVHYHFPWPYMDLLHFAARHGRPSLVTYHSDIVKQRVLKIAYAPLMHAFLRRMDYIVATSPNYAESSPVLRRHREKVRIVPIGLPDTSACIDDLNEEIFTTDRPFVLFSGVLRYYKGLKVLLDAATGVRCDIVILGSGPLEAELRSQIDTERLTNVRLVGPLSDTAKASLLRRCLAFVFPSNERSEAFGLSLIEAAMFSKPMVSTELGTGTSFVNIDGRTGRVVPPNDAAAFADAINDLVDKPREAAEQGQRARERYVDLFTDRGMGRRYHELYSLMLDQAQDSLIRSRR